MSNVTLTDLLTTNWPRVCLELRAYHKSAYTVARLTGSSKETINKLTNKIVKQPKFKVGIRLLLLHKKMIRDKGAAR